MEGFLFSKIQYLTTLKTGEDLVNEPFRRLIKKNELVAYKYDGFWASLDTYKDKQRLDEMVAQGNGSWEIWKKGLGSLGEKEYA